MNVALLKEALIKITSGIVLLFVLLFLPAGNLAWKQGWLFMAVLFIPMFLGGLWMYFRRPALLKSRLNAKEKQSEQKEVILYSGLMFIVSFVLAGLNERFHWTSLPKGIIILAVILFLLGYLLFAKVLQENEYLSRTIEVQENQTVVDTGLYGIVRHPMYSATLLLFLMMPLILNSFPSFVVMLVYIPIIIKRIKNEEEVLEKELKGYKEYKQKVKYRLIPYVW